MSIKLGICTLTNPSVGDVMYFPSVWQIQEVTLLSTSSDVQYICLRSILSSLSYTLGIVQWHIYAVDCMVFERTCVQILGMQIFASHIHNFNTPLLNCCQRIYCTLFVSGPQCPLGTYVEQLSSGVLSCVTCPANSNSVETNSPECTCFNGYHRTNLEGPNTPCTCEWNNNYFFTVDCISVTWPCMHYQ